MFLEGYKRNWLHTEGFSFEDRMIDDLSVSDEQSRHLDLFVFSPCLSPVNFPFTPESNGARGRRWGGGEGNKAGSPSSADSTLQSYGFDWKEVRLQQPRSELSLNGCAKNITNQVFVSILVNLTQTISIWHMQTLWQRWGITKDYKCCFNCWQTVYLIAFMFFSCVFRVATLVMKMKGERIWWKTLKMSCPLRCDSQNW